jgi:hypothetical protein
MFAVVVVVALAQPPGYDYPPDAYDYPVCRRAQPRGDQPERLVYESQRRGIRLSLSIGPERTRQYYEGPRYEAPRFAAPRFAAPQFSAPPPRFTPAVPYCNGYGGGCYGPGCYGGGCYTAPRARLPEIGIREAYSRP